MSKQQSNIKGVDFRAHVSERKGAHNYVRKTKRIRRTRAGLTSKRGLSNDSQYMALSHPVFTQSVKYFNQQIGINTTMSDTIHVPSKLSLAKNFEETMMFFREVNYSLYKSKNETVLNFKKCKYVSIGTITVLQIIVMHFYDFKSRFNERHFKKLTKEIAFYPSKDVKTNKFLYAMGWISEFDKIDEQTKSSFLKMELRLGQKSKKSYQENNKGAICTDVLNFVNNSMRIDGFELKPEGKNSLFTFMGEVLGNAEDHGHLNNYYVNGVSFREADKKDTSIIELNLAIINFGESIYRGFEKTKVKNIKIYDRMENLYKKHQQLMGVEGSKNVFTKSELYTLYGLQQGISRIKYTKKSRGNGTMNFIRAFMDMGMLGKSNKDYLPELHIISGSNMVECPLKYAPYKHKDKFILSLNEEKDLSKLPDKEYLGEFNDYFPGTILQVKIYMNKDFFFKELDDNGAN